MSELKPKLQIYVLLVSAILVGIHIPATAGELSGYSAVEYRYFLHESPYPEPSQHDPSAVLAPEYYHAWDEDNQSLIIAPFFRWDSQDSERTHFDVRELSWLKVSDDWELKLGVSKVYWGVTESQHLVDIINQTDQVENIDGEEKLGQSMINLSFFKDWGTLDLFVLPYFRERTFPSTDGRLRSNPPIDADKADYESGAGQHHIDAAIRWSQTFGNWDIGLSHFYGTSREPLFSPDRMSQKGLIPFYELINQTGMDVQMTTESWLWKLEVIRRESDFETFTASTGGFEYTFYGVLETNIDIGVIAEYLFDDRNVNLTSPFENDLMMGTRLTWNDEQSTELLLGVVQDLDSSDASWNLEASRRIGNRWKLSLEGRFFKVGKPETPLYFVRDDDYIQLELARYF